MPRSYVPPARYIARGNAMLSRREQQAARDILALILQAFAAGLIVAGFAVLSVAFAALIGTV